MVDTPQLDTVNSKLAGLIKQLAMSFFWLSIGFVAVIGMLLWHFADIVDNTEIEQSKLSAQSQLQRVGRALAVQTKDYGWWSPTMDNILVNKNEAWLEVNYRS